MTITLPSTLPYRSAVIMNFKNDDHVLGETAECEEGLYCTNPPAYGLSNNIKTLDYNTKNRCPISRRRRTHDASAEYQDRNQRSTPQKRERVPRLQENQPIPKGCLKSKKKKKEKKKEEKRREAKKAHQRRNESIENEIPKIPPQALSISLSFPSPFSKKSYLTCLPT